jgi:hypothetical protein
MSEVKMDLEAYEHLCDTVSKNKDLQLAHYGSTQEELQAAVDRISSGSAEPYPVTASPFARDSRPIAYYYPFSKLRSGDISKSDRLGRVAAKRDEVIITYNVNDKSHGLTGFTLSHTLPQVTAAPGYRVRWCHNVASNIVRHGIFKHHQTIIYSFDSITSDILLASPEVGEDSDSISLDLGNIPELQTMSTVLPQTETIFSPSFPFSSSDASAMFPLFKCAHSDDIIVGFIFKSDPQSLLIIAKEIPGPDGQVLLELVTPVKGERYATFKENGKVVESFSNPIAVSHHVYHSQDECHGNWCASGLDDPKSADANSFYVKQPFSFSTKNPAKSSLVTIDKINVPYPVTNVSWLAYQTMCEIRHVYSNYTTNPSPDFFDSVSSIRESGISNGKVTLLDAEPSVITSRMTPRHSARKRNTLPGIHSRNFGIRASDSTIKPGFLFNNGSMDFDISENDPHVFNGLRPESEDLYTVEARLFARVKYMFTSQCRSEQDRISEGKANIVVA